MKSLLWVDDDDEARFAAEADLIEDLGWQLTWAHSTVEAATALSSRPFTALILDQMLSNSVGVPRNRVLYGGCMVLYWLRRTPVHEPLCPWPAADPLWQALAGYAPLDPNVPIPATIISGYHDQRLIDAFKAASTADRSIRHASKPIDEQTLRRFLIEASP